MSPQLRLSQHVVWVGPSGTAAQCLYPSPAAGSWAASAFGSVNDAAVNIVDTFFVWLDDFLLIHFEYFS